MSEAAKDLAEGKNSKVDVGGGTYVDVRLAPDARRLIEGGASVAHAVMLAEVSAESPIIAAQQAGGEEF